MHKNENVKSATLEYFKGDELATNVWMTKYALKDKGGNYLEKTPAEMHERLAKEFSRMEDKFGGDRKLSKEEIYDLFKDFKLLVRIYV